ncbi:MAG: hypothetical protein K8T89_06085 [Planctomycetes bacterium]|nr:hypothetical protein [Planctomycetota bacterium]
MARPHRKRCDLKSILQFISILWLVGLAGCLPGPVMLNSPRGIQWGEPREGLQAGLWMVEVVDERQVRIVVIVRNVGAAAVQGPDLSGVNDVAQHVRAFDVYENEIPRVPLVRKGAKPVPLRTWGPGETWERCGVIDPSAWEDRERGMHPEFMQFVTPGTRPESPPLASPRVRFALVRLAM